MPFDSYSPLVYGKRGHEVGGFRIMEDGSNYGCCVCIGAAGIALTPLLAVLKDSSGLTMNFYFAGEIKTKTPSGNPVTINIKGAYPADGTIKIHISTEQEEKFTLRFRKPSWAYGAQLQGTEYTEQNGYFIVEKVWKEAELILELPMQIEKVELNEKTAFTYGPLVLALDEGKGNKDINESILLKENTGKVEIPSNKELFRYRVERENGEDLVFTDYASSGKNWGNSEDKISVWLNVKNRGL